MVGHWSCKTRYHKTPEAQIDAEYSTDGTYTAVDYDLDGSLVTGEYRETPDPVHGAVNWNDTWQISDEVIKLRFDPGNFATRYTQVATPDSARQYSVTADGGVHPTDETHRGSGQFGWIVNHGLPDTSSISVPFDAASRRWGSIPALARSSSDAPVHLFFDGRVESDDRRFQLIYSQSECELTP